MTDPDAVSIEFRDVGQGDCTIVHDPAAREALVIDCPAGAARAVLQHLRLLSLSALDVLVTHWDSDHYAGAVQIAKNHPARRLHYNLDTAYKVEAAKKDRRETMVRSLTDLGAVDRAHAQQGQTGTVGRCEWRLLAPSQGELTDAFNANDRNHGSAVVEITWADGSALVGGDADGRVWRRLLDEGSLRPATVLRCSHHGGRPSGSGVDDRAVLRVVRPRFFVVSAGTNNPHDHPARSLVTEAVASGARVLCTQATPRCAAAEGSVRACAGNVRVTSGSAGGVFPDRPGHESAMRGLEPMCLHAEQEQGVPRSP